MTMFKTIAVVLFVCAFSVIARPYEADPITDVFKRQAESNTTAVSYPDFAPLPSKKLQPAFPIHQSCNQSQTMQIVKGVDDLNRLLRSAIEHILTYGNESSVFETYFGQGADPAVPLGIYSRIVDGDKSTLLIRCDDPDQQCATQTEWAGHWRGNNATGETVLCSRAFQNRLAIEKVCTSGFSLVRDNVNLYWATDLLHRSMHLPPLTNDLVGHVADEYSAQLELAKTNVSESVRNQHSLQSFAFEAFVRANVDEQGCIGDRELDSEVDHDHDHDHDHQDAASTPPPTATASPQDCHTHADGTVHCS